MFGRMAYVVSGGLIGLIGVISLIFVFGIPSEVIAASEQVTICHDSKTMTVSENSSQNHVRKHESDFLGECGRGEIYGVDKNTKRMNDIYSPCDFEALLRNAGLTNGDSNPITVPECANGSTTKFNIVAVSGTLEEGFPLRGNLDFNEDGETVNSIFLGKALIRGLRANLDIKSPGWREFKPEPALNPVNPGMVATGNKNDANIYSVYGIDRRQAVKALLNEPRFLSMTPDAAFVDRNAEETSQPIKQLIANQIEADNNDAITNTAEATLLTVVSVWDSCHFVPSPILYTKTDGTRVTDFPNSLAAFAGVTDQMRIDDPAAYNAAVEAAVRQAVEETADCDKHKSSRKDGRRDKDPKPDKDKKKD